jgi:putative redox protein
MVTIEGTYRGDLLVEAVHGPSGTALETDAPADNMGQGRSFSPTDLVATSLGTCIVTILGIVARRRELDLGTMRFRVTKEMVADPKRRIGRLATTVWLPASVPEEARPVLEAAGRACPVHRSLHPSVEAPIEFVYE